MISLTTPPVLGQVPKKCMIYIDEECPPQALCFYLDILLQHSECDPPLTLWIVSQMSRDGHGVGDSTDVLKKLICVTVSLSVIFSPMAKN